ncbi:MAG: hypothetical protein RDU14_09940 [Melioribacteraceae bacterium]|nr:hypothetical protein [Melioribacteraceae bacterium]
MKYCLTVVMIFFYCSLFAQINIDSVLIAFNNIQPDSIDVSKLVQKQIESARLKEATDRTIEVEDTVGFSKNENIENAAIPISVSVINKPANNKVIELINSFSIEVKIFFLFSVLIILIVSLRRMLIGFKKRIKNSIKQRIAMIREEKIVLKKDRNKTRTRKSLKKDKVIEKLSEAGMNSKAKELSISKGEILLAARLKTFSYGK